MALGHRSFWRLSAGTLLSTRDSAIQPVTPTLMRTPNCWGRSSDSIWGLYVCIYIGEPPKLLCSGGCCPRRLLNCRQHPFPPTLRRPQALWKLCSLVYRCKYLLSSLTTTNTPIRVAF
ncbi:hypothetical protein EDC04DRAFT_2764838 [Pisolithus marmoratus]|nr:hypothetical protein EDC04DRAFT_2764838 [Pisolithus marmoratus]